MVLYMFVCFACSLEERTVSCQFPLEQSIDRLKLAMAGAHADPQTSVRYLWDISQLALWDVHFWVMIKL